MNRCRVLVLTLVLALVACTERTEPTAPGADALSNIAVTPGPQDCHLLAGDFNARLTTTTGETFWGEAAHDGDFVDADWAHTDPDWPDHPDGFRFESFDRGIAVTCVANGTISVFIDGFGVVNGELGYLYSVAVNDHGTSPTELVLESSEGGANASFTSPTRVVIPAELPVTSGTAGPGVVWISFDDMKCFYMANSSGDAYVFSRCEDPVYGPGALIEITSLEMQVAGPGRETIVVSASITVLPAGSIGVADRYGISVWHEASGELVYSFSGQVADGDIVVTLLP